LVGHGCLNYEKVLNVARHTDTTLVGYVVPFDINTRKFVSGHVELDPMKLLENIEEMVEVLYPNILHPKVINYETELDRTPFVVPKAWGVFGLVISLSKKAGLEEIVGDNADLGKAITVLANLKVDPPVTISSLKVALLNEFRQNGSNFSADIFGVWYRHIEVKFLRSMELKRAPRQESTLLRRSLTSSRDAVLVPTSPKKQM
jgi:hypothetical protein